MTDPDFIRRTLEDLKARDLYRHLVVVGSPAGPRVQVGGRTVLQFASNNYLGLAGDPRVREAACRAVEKWGWGAGASPLLAGHTDAHAALEADLATFKRTEAALVFPSGYMTNLGILSALVGPGDTVVMDRENHASLYDAVRLSGARLERYKHADAAAGDLLAASLGKAERGRTESDRAKDKSLARRVSDLPRDEPAGRMLLATDTVFSMGGDLAPLAALADACRRAGVMLVLDEAHALGLLGPTGAGLAEQISFEPAAGAADGSPVASAPQLRYSPPATTVAGSEIIASVGTLSKALGGIGGFVAASREVCDLIVNRARPFIYSTALPAAACEAAREALRISREEPERRRRVLALADRLRATLRDKGFDTGRSATPIIPIMIGEPEAALATAAALLAHGIFCPAIRPPTVAPGTSRLRVSLTADHTEEDVDRLVAALVEIRGHAARKL